MKTYPIIKIDLQLNAEAVKANSGEGIKQFVEEQAVPVLINHLATTRDATGDIHCTADNHGNVSCSGGVSVHF